MTVEKMDVDDPGVTPETMLQYYSRLYPFKAIHGWLNHEHNPTKLFTHREFAFTLANDAYLRYKSFASAEDMKRDVCKFNPARFEIGAVYSLRPKDKKTIRSGQLVPQLRELVFDIDMTDYDAVRTCCSGKGICKRCWGFISSAVKVLDTAFREDFGYKHILWVYSGRRGIHAWISDKAAMELTDEQRRAMMGWLEVTKGGKDMAKKVNVRNTTMQSKGRVFAPPALHPFLQEAFSALRGDFEGLILEDQDCFKSPAGWQLLLQLLPDTDLRARLTEAWEDEPEKSSADKWADIGKEMKSLSKEDRAIHRSALEEVVLQYTYPRLDSEVTKHRNHLLKAPFCIHPATGRVCVPIVASQVDKFDPETVPTVGQLLREIDHATATGMDQQDWGKTSLKPYIDILDQHVLALMAETRAIKREKPSLEY